MEFETEQLKYFTQSLTTSFLNLFINPSFANARALRDGGVLLFVCSFVSSLVCLLWNMLSHSLCGSTWRWVHGGLSYRLRYTCRNVQWTMQIYVAVEKQCYQQPITTCVNWKNYLVDSMATFNPLIATLKPQSNGPSYSNTVTGTLAVDGWVVTFGTARRGLGGAAARPCPSSLYQM